MGQSSRHSYSQVNVREGLRDHKERSEQVDRSGSNLKSWRPCGIRKSTNLRNGWMRAAIVQGLRSFTTQSELVAGLFGRYSGKSVASRLVQQPKLCVSIV